MATEYDVGIKITSDASEAQKDLASTVKEVKKLGASASSVDELAKSLDDLSKQMKKIGRDFSTLVTAPIAALAALSLKNVFDLGAIERSTGQAREFALAVQGLQKNFKQLMTEVGTAITPFAQGVIKVLNNLINAFRNLGSETQKTILIIAGIAAAIGPSTLALSSLLGFASKLLPVFVAIGTGVKGIIAVLTSPITLIVALAGAVAGLINTFVKLKDAGVSTGEALIGIFKLLGNGFLNYFVKYMIQGAGLVFKALEKITSMITGNSKNMWSKTVTDINEGVATIEKDFNASKDRLNKSLSTVGTDLGSTMTFGITDKFKAVVDNVKNLFSGADLGGKLNSELGKDFQAAAKNIEMLNKEHHLALEREALDHANKLAAIDQTSDPQAALEERIQLEREFLAKRFELRREAAEKEMNDAILAAQSLGTEQEKINAAREAAEKNLVEQRKIDNEQILENTKLTNQEEEESYRLKYDKIKGYADMFSSGLTDGFIEIAEGTKSVGRAFEDFAKSFLKQIAQMILKQTILNAVMGSMGFAGGGPVGRYATGGPVRGAGSGTSDSIPAWLSNGEYVIDAKTTRHFGNNFFRNLQSMAKGGVPFSSPSPVAKFADGGAVTSSSQAPQVVIENSGSEKQVASTSFDPKTSITTIILEDLGKNGPVSRGIQNTFGMKRGGFA